VDGQLHLEIHLAKDLESSKIINVIGSQVFRMNVGMMEHIPEKLCAGRTKSSLHVFYKNNDLMLPWLR
jgi:hypothetical protein